MKPIEKKSILDQVVRSLEDAVLCGKYSIGDKLPSEFELCSSLGVSRSTVREAYRTLQVVGSVEVQRGKGYFLKRTVSLADGKIEEWFSENKARLSDLMEIRFALEPLAVKLSIERESSEQLKEINNINEAFCQAAAKYDPKKLAILDEAFHTSIMKSTNNELLIRINTLIAAALRDYRARSFSVEENALHAVLPHSEILKCINDKNIQGAVNAMVSHLQLSLDDIEGVVSKEGN